MTVGFLLLNAAYLVYTASAAFREILYLRAVLLMATVLFMVYGLVDPELSVFYWNIPTFLLHSYAIWKLVSERRSIDLNHEAEAIHTLLFPDLDRVAFNTMWHCGVEREYEDEVVLITKGEPVNELTMILAGDVDVEVNDELIVRLSQYRLIGEMSSLSGDVASATVTTLGSVRAHVWDKEALAACGQKQPQIELALVKAMGHEVARKLN